MDAGSAFALGSLGMAAVHWLYDSWTLGRRCEGRPAYERNTSLQKTVLKTVCLLFPFLVVPGYYTLNDVFESGRDFQIFLCVGLVAFNSGPALAFAVFGNPRAAVAGFSLRAAFLFLALKLAS